MSANGIQRPLPRVSMNRPTKYRLVRSGGTLPGDSFPAGSFPDDVADRLCSQALVFIAYAV
jgi:hypothetical protein